MDESNPSHEHQVVEGQQQTAAEEHFEQIERQGFHGVLLFHVVLRGVVLQHAENRVGLLERDGLLLRKEGYQAAERTAEEVLQHTVHVTPRILVPRYEREVLVGLAVGLVRDKTLFSRIRTMVETVL